MSGDENDPRITHNKRYVYVYAYVMVRVFCSGLWNMAYCRIYGGGLKFPIKDLIGKFNPSM